METTITKDKSTWSVIWNRKCKLIIARDVDVKNCRVNSSSFLSFYHGLTSPSVQAHFRRCKLPWSLPYLEETFLNNYCIWAILFTVHDLLRVCEWNVLGWPNWHFCTRAVEIASLQPWHLKKKKDLWFSQSVLINYPDILLHNELWTLI